MSLLFDPSDDLLKYNSIRLEYFKLAENLANNFLQYDYPSFKNMDTVHTKCNERVFNKLNQAVDTAIRSLIAADINDVDDNTFINQY
ncbi:hypothetical protein, partial [Alkanindiges hydrocarboniclasticus]|uniref:hypothetical protein n=1 Tax=Alkanindiges hydrocarboniclasticus TaxID=1907941 RepID=UPI0011786B2F